MISQGHLAKVRSYIELGPKEGATLLCGGLGAPLLPDRVKKGNYVLPTVFADVDNRMKIAQDEIFGPVACLIPFDDEADAIRIANDTLRPVQLRLDREHRPRAPRRRGGRSRHVLRQQPERARPAPAVRRHQGVGHRPRRRHLELRGVPGAEEHRGVAGFTPHPALGCLTMGKLALAAKITHVPSMYLSELDGPRKGTRQDAIDGHREIGRRCRELGVDTIVVFDSHWLVNANYHINCAPAFEGLYTSNELPHFISNMPFAFPGNPALGKAMAKACNAWGVETLAHHATTLNPEYGTLVPMRYMNEDRTSRWCRCRPVHGALPERQRAPGLGHPARHRGRLRRHRRRVRQRLAVAPLRAERPGARVRLQDLEPVPGALDRDVVRHWQQGEWKQFCGMLPEYAAKGHGEGFMHDTAMLLGALGWSAYDGKAEVVTPLLRRLGHRPDQRRVPGDAAGRRRHPESPGLVGRGLHRHRQPPLGTRRMPHLVILYTPNVEPRTDMTALCRTLADGMLQVRDEAGKQVFPTGGTRVLAYPAAHYAVADGQGDYAFLYMNLRMAAGRSDAVKKAAGDAVLERAKAHLAPLFEQGWSA
jgi:3,4-dihydroxyphenylacetate 2,3-dioxygenase